jgi:death-on-curing protein
LSKIYWVEETLFLELHKRVIEASGGSHGVLNQGMLESALNRPLQRAAYDDSADLFHFAAAYAYGIIKNHPFIDGNKRTGMLAIRAFLYRNGFDFDPEDNDGVETAVKVASSEMDESALAAWIRANSRPHRK